MADYFYYDLTRDECCKFYADLQGEKYNFTDKDYAWVDEYNYAMKMDDIDLRNFVESELA